MATDKQRETLLNRARFLISKEPQVHYAATRPMRNFVPRKHHWPPNKFRLNHGGSMAMDCSEAVTLLFYWAGLQDPNGFGYNGWGNSTTMWQNLPKYKDPHKAHTGAIGIYGPEHHAVMVMERGGSDPWLFSHGWEGGPNHWRKSEEDRYHQGQEFWFLDISKL